MNKERHAIKTYSTVRKYTDSNYIKRFEPIDFWEVELVYDDD